MYSPTFHDFIRADQENIPVLCIECAKNVVPQNKRTMQEFNQFVPFIEEFFREAQGQEAF
jgi:hypothetical protein